MIEIFTYEFMVRAMIGMILICIATGMLGPFIVLRRLSLVGDGLAHLAFGGVALGFLLEVNPLLTAIIVMIIGSLVIRKLLENDTFGEVAIALILSFGVGLGVVIIGATKGFGVNLFSYLIGSILTITWEQILYMGVLLLIIMSIVRLFYRELFLLTFQKDLLALKTKKAKIADLVFAILIALVTFMTIQAVGILLVSAMLVIPAIISLKLGKSFKATILYSIGISIFAGISGIIGSYYLDIPPSGFIVMLLVTIYFLIISKK